MERRFEPCGALTLKGEPCKIARMSCTVHRRAQREGTAAHVRAQAPAGWGQRRTSEGGRGAQALAIPGAVDEHNLREFAWWLVGRLLTGELDAQRAGVLATLMRVVAALGPEPVSRERAFAEAALRGRMMHGLPPRNADEWAIAESLFSQEVLDEFAGYARLLEEAGGSLPGRPFGFAEGGAEVSQSGEGEA